MNFNELHAKMINNGSPEYWGTALNFRMWADSPHFENAYLLRAADRGYMEDNRSGNYLNDFLKENGRLDALTPITFDPGDARTRGAGLQVVV